VDGSIAATFASTRVGGVLMVKHAPLLQVLLPILVPELVLLLLVLYQQVASPLVWSALLPSVEPS
jgi:hypothetical protein